MSEDFDKEAEREKLREQFEAERERREATQQMSELLLKGATMTNKHCDTCGDPIFRHDGREFCATCQTSGPADGGEVAEEPAPDADTDRGADAVPVEPQSRSAPDPDPVDRRAEPEPEPELEPEPERTPAAETPARRPDAPAEETTPSPAANATPSPAETAPSAASTAPGNDLDAPAALRRSLEKFSRLAAESDDPREAREHLAAAREAAEALDALRR